MASSGEIVGRGQHRCLRFDWPTASGGDGLSEAAGGLRSPDVGSQSESRCSADKFDGPLVAETGCPQHSARLP